MGEIVGSEHLKNTTPKAAALKDTERKTVVEDDGMLGFGETLVVSQEEAIQTTPMSLHRAVDHLPEKLDHFQIQEKLGEGGMGAVFLANDTSLDRPVAIKVLPPELACRADLKQRFLREARAQARLNSPHVAHIYYIGDTTADAPRETFYFAMELIRGGSLGELLEEGKVLDPEEARQYMVQVAKGLRDAQDAGIIHRDIKPSNLMLDERGKIKIVDFGVAKPLNDEDSKITHYGMILGSPHYMAPEQAMGDEVDFRADMYAIGCTFFHLLSGQLPFDGNNAFAIANKHVNVPFPSLQEIAPHLPYSLVRIIERLCSKQAQDRYVSYDELLEALEAAKPKETHKAGFWVRGVALFIDLVIAGLFIGVVGWVGFALQLIYWSYATGRWGKTLGKHLMNLRVVRLNGRRLGFGRAAGRTIALLWQPLLVGMIILFTEGSASFIEAVEYMQPTHVETFKSWLIAAAVSNGLISILYFMGLGMAAFHSRGQALHDLVAGSQVIYQHQKPSSPIVLDKVVKRSMSGILKTKTGA